MITVQIPLLVLVSVLVASLAPWLFLVAGGSWMVWHVVKEPAQ